jgi:hypothetical protein
VAEGALAAGQRQAAARVAALARLPVSAAAASAGGRRVAELAAGMPAEGHAQRGGAQRIPSDQQPVQEQEEQHLTMEIGNVFGFGF